MRRRLRKVSWGVLLMLLLLPGLYLTAGRNPATQGRTSGRINSFLGGALLSERGYMDGNEIQVLIEYNTFNPSGALWEEIAMRGGRVLNHLPAFKMIAVKMPSENISLFQESDVRIYLDRKFYACMDQSVPLIKPPAQWAQIETYFGHQINGSGITVAVLDTGIEDAHPDLNDLDDNISTVDPKILVQKSFVVGNANPDDDNGHGTHVAGIIGSTGEEGRAGVAPGCYLLNYKVLNASGVGYESWILEAIQWALDNGSDVINLSLASVESGDGTDPLSQAIEAAWAQGVPVVLAAGRNGTHSYSIGKPGVCAKAITVGSTSDTALAATSPWGPTQDFRLKPDILAPGEGIYSCDDDASFYVSMSGTSQAAAHVAGAVTLLLQAHPAWSPDQIKDALLSTATLLGLEPYKQGAGLTYLPEAINISLKLPSVLDYGLYKINETLERTIQLANAYASPLTVTYETDLFALNVSNPFSIPALGSVAVQLTPNLSAAVGYRLWEYVNFSCEGRTQHLIGCGIRPNLIMTAPSESLLYNTTFNISLQLDLDVAPVTFLQDAQLVIQDEAIGVLTKTNVTGSGNVTVLIQNSSLYRGAHMFITTFSINSIPIQSKVGQIYIRGYNSTMTIQDWEVLQWAGAVIPLNHSQNVSGPIQLYRLQGSTWVLVTIITTPAAPFEFPINLAAGTHLFKAVFVGDALYEPCEAIFRLTVQPNYAPLSIPLIAGAIVGVGLFFYAKHWKRRRTRRALRDAIITRERMKRAIIQTEKNIQTSLMQGEAVEEPESIAPPPLPERRFSKEELLYEPEKRHAQHLYDASKDALQTGPPLEEPDTLVRTCPRCQEVLAFNVTRRQYHCDHCDLYFTEK